MLLHFILPHSALVRHSVSNFGKLTVDEAIAEAKERDGNRCVICNRSKEDGWSMAGAHLFVRRCPFPRYAPNDPDMIITLCFRCHAEMDAIKNHSQRAKFLREAGVCFAASIILWVIGSRKKRPKREAV